MLRAAENQRFKEKWILIGLASILIFTFFISIASADDWTYQYVNDTFHNFTWYNNSIVLQIKSCSLSDCSDANFVGPSNSTSQWFNNSNLEYINGTTNATRYFQYKAKLNRNSDGTSPLLYNITVSLYNQTELDPLSISPDPAYEYSSRPTCSATAYTQNTNVNITFTWYKNGVFQSSATNASTSGVQKSFDIPQAQKVGEVWNCTVNATDGVTNDTKSTTITISQSPAGTYATVGDVFHELNWYNNSMALQVRSCSLHTCSDASFIGYDNTSNTWFNNSNYNYLNETSLNASRYFQYKTKLNRNSDGTSPLLWNVSLETNNMAEGVNQNLTIEVWVYRTGFTGRYMPLICKWNDTASLNNRSYCLVIDENNKARFYASSDGNANDYVSSTSGIPLNTWTFIAAAYNGSDMSIFINGQLENQNNWAYGISNKY